MTITRKDVADLREGDVVELRHPDADWTITGPLVRLFGGLGVAGWAVTDTHPDSINARLDVRVIKRAPRPLYVNHPRTEPVPGDVVTYPDRHIEGIGPWFAHRKRDGGDIFWMSPTGPVLGEMPARLRLLVDGETGQVVP